MKKIQIILLLALCAIPMSAQHNRREHHRGHISVETHTHFDEKDGDIFASPEQVKEIISYPKSLSFDKERLQAAMLCVKLCPIASEDLGRIIKTFSFEDGRIELLKMAYPYCPDKRHYYEAVNQLSFLSSRDNVYNYIEKHYRD